MALTDTAIRNLKPGPKTRKVSDGHGMYLEISPAGGRWWRLKYRYACKEKRLSLGVYPAVGLKDARSKREDARKLLAEGKDPSVERRVAKLVSADRSANSFEVVAREWFAKQMWALSHSSRVKRRLDRDLIPYLGTRPIADITAPELLAVVRRTEARTVETAHRALRDCGQIFRYGIATGRCDRNPGADLRGALGTFSNRHFAATLEPKRLGAILRAMDNYSGTLVVASALRLAPMLLVRPGELRHAEWPEIDLDAAEWKHFLSKTRTGKPKIEIITPLSWQAVEVLQELKKLTGEGKKVFPSARSATRPMSDMAVLSAMRSLQIGKEEMTGHGFRAVARTFLDEVLGFRPEIIEHQLGHAVRDPNGRAYNRTSFLEERRRMMQAWADHLDHLKAQVLIMPARRSA